MKSQKSQQRPMHSLQQSSTTVLNFAHDASDEIYFRIADHTLVGISGLHLGFGTCVLKKWTCHAQK
jgi:hypothetical protein